MRMAKWLSGVWVVCALGCVVANIRCAFSAQQFNDMMGSSDVIVSLAIAGLMLVLYGFNYRVLTCSDKHFALKSLFPAACPNFYLVPFSLLVASRWGDWDDPELPLIVLLTAASVLLVVLGITVLGWIGRRPRVYLIALVFVGILTTAIHFGIVGYFWNTPPMKGWDDLGRISGLLVGLVVFALPGLWAALACLLATLLDASPRTAAVSSLAGELAHRGIAADSASETANKFAG